MIAEKRKLFFSFLLFSFLSFCKYIDLQTRCVQAA